MNIYQFLKKPESTVTLSVKEKKIDYGLVIPTFEKPSLNKKLDVLETTTVWIFPTKDFEEQLNKNVIDRYSNGCDYSTITFVSHTNRDIKFTGRKEKERIKLLFIKSPFLNNSPSYSNIEYYVKEIKNIVNQELPNISKDGFLVVQTQDVRMDGYIEPLAKKIVDVLAHNNLWLKEIIVVTQEGTNSNSKNSAKYLKIVHQYLLVYEVKK